MIATRNNYTPLMRHFIVPQKVEEREERLVMAAHLFND